MNQNGTEPGDVTHVVKIMGGIWEKDEVEYQYNHGPPPGYAFWDAVVNPVPAEWEVSTAPILDNFPPNALPLPLLKGTLLASIPPDVNKNVIFQYLRPSLPEPPKLKTSYKYICRLGTEWKNPCAMAVHWSGAIFVADTVAARVQIFAKSGEFLGSYGSKYWPFAAPCGLAFDPEGCLVVIDREYHKVFVIDVSDPLEPPEKTPPLYAANGGQLKFKYIWGQQGQDDGDFHDPSGVVVNRQGDIFITERKNHRVQRFTNSGTWMNTFGFEGDAPGQLFMPHGIALDPRTGDLIIADANTVQLWNPRGEFIRYILPGFEPGGMAVDREGRIVVVDYRGRCEVFSPEGKRLLSIDHHPTSARLPLIDYHGNLLIPECDNATSLNQIRILG